MTTQRTLPSLLAAIQDAKQEGALFEDMQAIRTRFSSELMMKVRHSDRDRGESLMRAHQVLSAVLGPLLSEVGTDNFEPGHGPGHWTRDYVHALWLATDPDTDPLLTLWVTLGGTLHDAGTLLVDRYADKTRALRHAEVGALVIRALALETGVLTEDEADVAAYTVAAHTHYLRPSEVTCADGVTRVIEPYKDMVEGEPLPEVWMPRWADRLDVSGPCFVGRHYLTLARDHHDFDGANFYAVTFGEHMRPLLRSGAEIKAGGGKRTMLEHLQMFASSQTNDSPYGRWDRGQMVTLRDRYRDSLQHIINSSQEEHSLNRENVLTAWTIFLRTNVEPYVSNEVLQALDKNLRAQDEATIDAWVGVFYTTMKEYEVWAEHMLAFLSTIPEPLLELTGLFDDVRDVIRPANEWTNLL